MWTRKLNSLKSQSKIFINIFKSMCILSECICWTTFINFYSYRRISLKYSSQPRANIEQINFLYCLSWPQYLFFVCKSHVSFTLGYFIHAKYLINTISNLKQQQCYYFYWNIYELLFFSLLWIFKQPTLTQFFLGTITCFKLLKRTEETNKTETVYWKWRK